MVRNIPTKIKVHACTKCNGALKQDNDPTEWFCMNCGKRTYASIAPTIEQEKAMGTNPGSHYVSVRSRGRGKATAGGYHIKDNPYETSLSERKEASAHARALRLERLKTNL